MKQHRLWYTSIVSFSSVNAAEPARLPVGPSFWVAGVGLTGLSLVLAFVPLFNLLAYEFCAALSLLMSALAGPVAIGVLRRTRDAQLSVGRTCLRALVACFITLAPALVVILLNALRVKNCNLLTGFVFFLLLPMATAAVCTCWGLALGLLIRRRLLAGLAYAGLWIAVAMLNLLEVWSGLQVDSYNQLVGWVAGPIYDSVVEPSWPLAASRLHGLAWGVFLLALSSVATRARGGRTGLPGIGSLRRRTLVALVLSFVGGLLLWIFDSELGFGRSTAAVDEILSGTTRTEHFVLHHSPKLKAHQIETLARDHEFRLHQIDQRLGPLDLPLIHSYLFPNAGQKRALVGAARTQYAKPWSYLMCLNGSAYPHPTLKHELVHVVGAAFGSWPFGVSARGGVLVNPGLTEGLAVALDWPADRFDRHTWSAALRRIGKAPAIEGLFDPVGFWTAAAGRAYTLAGSFVRFLLDTHGPQPLIDAYRDGRLEGHYPKDRAALIADWQAFLDGLELDEATLEVARHRFSKKSVFEQDCAHEVASLRKRATSLLAAGDFAAAERTAQRILEHLPDDRWALELLMEHHQRTERVAEALAIAERLLRRDDLQRVAKARLRGRMGDLWMRLGKPERAAEHQRAVLAAQLGDASDRLALVKLQALERWPKSRRLLEFLARGKPDALFLLDLHELATAEEDWGVVWYLIGRQLFNRERFGRAVGYLRRAGQSGLGHAALAAENLRLLAMCYHRLAIAPDKRTDQAPHGERAFGNAVAALAVIAQFPRHRAELLEARDWLERVYFDRTVPVARHRGKDKPRR